MTVGGEYSFIACGKMRSEAIFNEPVAIFSGRSVKDVQFSVALSISTRLGGSL